MSISSRNVRDRCWQAFQPALIALLCAGLACACRGSDHSPKSLRGEAEDPSASALNPEPAFSDPEHEGPAATVPGESATATETTSTPPALGNGCSSDTECTHVEYGRDVTSEADCYCPQCPGDFGRLDPVNISTAEAQRQRWTEYCGAWAEEYCEPFPCPVPRSPICNGSGTCTLPPVEASNGPVPTRPL
jgi:hypothetical protein